MATTADVKTDIWPELDGLSNDAALLYLWSFTNPAVNVAGLYKITRRNLGEGRFDDAQLDAALNELRDRRFLYYADNVVWVRTRVKHWRTKNDRAAKSIADTIRTLGSHELVDAFVKEYRHIKGFSYLTAELATLEAEGVITTDKQADAPSKSLRVVEAKPRAKAVKHNGKAVPSETVSVAEQILASFNEQAGTKYGAYTGAGDPSENLKRIIGAVTAHPEITPDIGAAMVRQQLANPYWQGTPDAGNVFGPKIVERNLEAARHPRANGTTAPSDEQMRRLLR